MDVKRILDFLSELTLNNNREWFALHKDEYQVCRHDFEAFVEQWIEQMSDIEPSLRGLSYKDCIWRIYRDTRFSPDKTPYKDHFGAFLAQKGGKRSQYAGYYLHLQPDGHCMFASGMWCPEPDLLKAVRMSIYDNADEVEEIMQNPHFRKYFRDFDTDYMLKKVPAGFPADFEHADWLKRKLFTLSCTIKEKDIIKPDFMSHLLDICKAAKPMNDFLNYAFEEM